MHPYRLFEVLSLTLSIYLGRQRHYWHLAWKPLLLSLIVWLILDQAIANAIMDGKASLLTIQILAGVQGAAIAVIAVYFQVRWLRFLMLGEHGQPEHTARRIWTREMSQFLLVQLGLVLGFALAVNFASGFLLATLLSLGIIHPVSLTQGQQLIILLIVSLPLAPFLLRAMLVLVPIATGKGAGLKDIFLLSKGAGLLLLTGTLAWFLVIIPPLIWQEYFPPSSLIERLLLQTVWLDLLYFHHGLAGIFEALIYARLAGQLRRDELPGGSDEGGSL